MADGVSSVLIGEHAALRRWPPCNALTFWILDSPAKVYSLGPGQTISNFEIHLKNKQHRENVAARRQATGT